MNKNRQTKTMAIVALMLAVVGMTLGFAAFSRVLTISSSATVTPNEEDFKIVFSGSATDTDETTIVPTIVGNATATNATISNEENMSITGMSVSFTEPGQSVSYVGYGHNVGKYVVYSKKVIFNNLEGETSFKKCVAEEGATQELVDLACEAISLTYVAEIPRYSPIKGIVTSTVENSKIYNDIQVGEYAIGTTIIEYAADGARADGPFTVQFGDLELVFMSSNG